MGATEEDLGVIYDDLQKLQGSSLNYKTGGSGARNITRPLP